MARLLQPAAEALFTYMRDHELAATPHFRRETTRLLLQSLMEWEVTAAIQAGHYERNGKRKTYRNGYRVRTWASQAGEIALHIPKLRSGSYWPAFLNEAEHQLASLILRAYTDALDQTHVENICRRLEIPAPPTDELYLLQQSLSTLREREQQQPIQTAYDSLWLDSLPLPGAQVLRIALGIDASGRADLLAYETAHAYDEDWDQLLARLSNRGLEVNLVLSEAYGEIYSAVGRQLPRTHWRYQSRTDLLRLLTQIRNLHQSDIVIAIADLMLVGEYETDVRFYSLSGQQQTQMLAAAPAYAIGRAA
jgi:putative transposase